MKLLFSLAFIMVLLLHCKRENNGLTGRLGQLQGIWKIRSFTCFENPNVMAYTQPDAYFKFNSDLSGFVYHGSQTNTYDYFTYRLLGDDSTLVWRYTDPRITLPDTTVITVLSPTELIYHGKNTSPNRVSQCGALGNRLDSLFR